MLAYGVIAVLCGAGLVGIALGLGIGPRMPNAGTDVTTIPGVATGEPPPSANEPLDALVINDDEVGTGAVARVGDVVEVHYTGTLADGTEFDASRKRGVEPFRFELGKNHVIAGWEQGVAGMRVGGKRKLRIPPHLGYGTRGAGAKIPPNSVLFFDVELIGVQRKSGTQEPLPKGDPLEGVYTIADATRDLPGNGRLVADISTPVGDLSCALFESQAPNTVANFIGLATGKRVWRDPRTQQWVNRTAYDGTSFHRIIKDFMIQGGDPKGDGTGEPGFTIKDEIWEGSKHNRAGLLCAANRGPNTNGAQFFITDAAAPHLDGGYTIFGSCTKIETIHAIAERPTTGSERPETPIPISSVSIWRMH